MRVFERAWLAATIRLSREGLGLHHTTLWLSATAVLIGIGVVTSRATRRFATTD